MPEYIDRDKLPVKQILIGGPMLPRIISVVDVDDIAAAPAADVVEVVRCKDCRNLYFKDMSAYCPYRVGACKPDSFCSYGKRRNEQKENRPG